MITGLRRRCGDDTGASLIIAIAFMTFLGLVSTALLTYTSTSLRSTASTKSKAKSTYAIDAALQAGVNKVRTEEVAIGEFFTNTPGRPDCPDFNAPNPNFPSLNEQADVAVTCDARMGTGGAGGTVEINPNNRPANALLTLGTGTEIGVDKGSNNVLLIHGGVHINSTPTSIRQSGSACPATPAPPPVGASCSGTWTQAGNLVARGTCSGTVVVAPGFTKSCSPANPIAADPSYAQPSGPLLYQPTPSCGAGPTITFEPGYYDDAVALSALTNGTGCAGKTLWFKPGVYYFDFHNGEGPLPAAPHIWLIDDAAAEVVGGTPQGWAPALGNPSVPGSCVSPLASATNGGVEFVFGGDSRLDVRAGKIELCGRYSTTRPPIALYGARTGADPAAITATLKTTGASAASGPVYTNIANITEQDGVPATSVIDATSAPAPMKASITLTGFAPPVSVPAGSLLTSAKLMVRHRDNNDAGSALSGLQVQVKPNRPGATTIDALVPRYTDGPAGGSYHLDAVDLSSLASEVHDFGLSGLDVIYDATVPAGQKVTENLDSIQLVLTWKPPAVRGQTTTPISGVANCIAIVGGCPMIRTVSPNTRLYVQGTTYAPLAKLDLKITNVATSVFTVGVVARAMAVQITASAALGSLSMINVPPLAPGGPATPLEVFFRAYTCPAGGCAGAAPGPGWKLSGTARAKYENLGAQGYDKVSVMSWTVRST